MENLTNKMETKILEIMDNVAEAGGMFEAARSGLVQKIIGESAARFQSKIESGEQTWVGINRYLAHEESQVAPLERPDRQLIDKHLSALRAFKAERSNENVSKALDNLSHAAENENINIFEKIVEAVEFGATHGEVCGRLRRDLGFGYPLVAA